MNAIPDRAWRASLRCTIRLALFLLLAAPFFHFGDPPIPFLLGDLERLAGWCGDEAYDPGSFEDLTVIIGLRYRDGVAEQIDLVLDCFAVNVLGARFCRSLCLMAS